MPVLPNIYISWHPSSLSITHAHDYIFPLQLHATQHDESCQSLSSADPRQTQSHADIYTAQHRISRSAEARALIRRSLHSHLAR